VSDASVELKAILKDEISTGLVTITNAIKVVQTETEAASKSLDNSEKNWKAQANAIAETTRRLRDQADAQRFGTTEYDKLSHSLENATFKLLAQRDALQDPAFRDAYKHTEKLRQEVNELSKSIVGQNEHEKGLLSTTRARREVLVMMHEASQGRFKNLAGSAMVLGEYTDAGWMQSLTSAITPLNVGIAALAATTIGLGAAMWKASEAAAENYHHLSQLGLASGVSGQTMLGLQQMTVGTKVTVDQLGLAFGRFTINLEKHNKELAQVGITAKDPLQAFEQLMDFTRNTSDETERNTILNMALGRSWQQLLPVLMQGGAAARDAIESMKIPEEVIRNYERANEAQIAIDKDFAKMKKSSGEFFSSFRAQAKELEVGFLDLFTGTSAMDRAVEAHYRELGGDPKKSGKPSEETMKARIEASKAASAQLSKDNVEEAIKGAKEEWAARLEVYRDGAKKWQKARWTVGADPNGEYEAAYNEYARIAKAEEQAISDIRKRFAKKDRVKDAHARLTFDQEAARNVVGGNMVHDGLTPEQKAAQRDREKSDELDLQREKRLRARIASLDKEINAQEQRTQKAQTHVLEVELKERMRLWESYADRVQGLAANEIAAGLKGQLTLTKAYEMARDAAIDMFAEKSTKYIESIVEDAVFGKAASAEAVAQATVTGSAMALAYAPAAAFAEIASFGGASVSATAGLSTTAAFADAIALHPRARGGDALGPRMVGERGAEAFTPYVPGRITPAHVSTSTTYGGPVTIHVSGAGDARATAREIAKILPRAQRLASMDRRQSSLS
jgi:hypothetical protein